MSANEPEKKDLQTPKPEGTASEGQRATEQSQITEADVLHTLIEEYKIRDDQNACLQRRNFLLGVATAILLFAYTTITALQWCALLESNRTSREALTSVQRAFVSLKGIAPSGAQDNRGEFAWWFIPQWENSGTTPTRVFRQRSSYSLRPEPLPDGFNFCDGETGESTVTFIAPESTVSANPIPISQTDLTKVQEGTLHLYFWGWAAYRDVFRDSKVHLTEFCSKLTTISGDIATGNVRFVYTHCPSHNCADETCEDYREVEQRLTNLSEQKSCG